MPADELRQSLDAQPDLATLNCGSMNFGPDGAVFLNPPALIEESAAEIDRRGIVREYECFDIGMAVTARRMLESAPDPPGMMHLVLGVLGGAPPTIGSVSMFARMGARRGAVDGERDRAPELPEHGDQHRARRPRARRP